MKAVINQPKPPNGFPKLMISIDDPESIYYFFYSGYGYPINGSNWNVTHFIGSQGKLDMSEFEDFTGSITLSND
jgi:hypothetical protein